MFLDLTIQNSSLTRLRSIKPADGQNTLAIPNSALPGSLKAGLGLAYTAFTGNKLDPAATTLLATFDAGEFSRLYGPAIYKTDADELVLKWGDELLAIEIKDGSFVIGDAEGELLRQKYGKYEETGISFYLEEDGSEYTFFATIKLANYKEVIEPAKVKAKLKKGDPSAFLALVGKQGQSAAGNRPRIEVDLSNAWDIRPLIPNERDAEGKAIGGKLELVCWGAQRIKTSYGSTYALRVPEQPGLEVCSNTSGVITLWSHKSLNELFDGGFAPTEPNPGVITISKTPWATDESKFRYYASVEGECWLEDDSEALDLSFLG